MDVLIHITTMHVLTSTPGSQIEHQAAKGPLRQRCGQSPATNKYTTDKLLSQHDIVYTTLLGIDTSIQDCVI